MVPPIERVTNLLTLLLERRAPLTLQQIFDELGGQYPGAADTQRSMFERDKSMLRQIGVPIDTEVLGGTQAGQTGYLIDRRKYELHDLQLDDDEHHQHGAHRSAHHGAQRLPTSDSPRSATRTPRWLRSAQRVLRPILKLARNALLAPYEIFTLLLQVMTSDGL